MIKVLRLNSTGPLPESLQKRIKREADYISHTQANITEAEAVELAQDAEIIIVEPSALKPIRSSFICRLKKLKHIALTTVGYDWVDIETCQQQGISISRPVGANSEAVAEHTFGLLIDLAKRITEFDRDVRSKGAYDFRKYTGVELYGKTLGIIGLGNIGHKVCRISKGFNMKVLAFDRSETTTRDYKIVNLPTLLQKSDFITVCIPLTKETRNLIGEKEIRMMKDGVILVNTAREAIVNKQAIIKAIKSKKVRGYGLETAVMVKIDPGDDYLKYPNIVINPHNAFNTYETDKKVDEMVVDNVVSFIKGRPKNLLKFGN